MKFTIHAGENKRFEKSVKKLARHASKMGYGEVKVLSTGKPYERIRTTAFVSVDGDVSESRTAFMVCDVELQVPVQFENAVEAEYKVIGKVLSAEGSAEVTADGLQMAKIVKVAEGYDFKCQAKDCGHKLMKAFAVEAKADGKILFIGSECLNKYTGADAQAILALVEFVSYVECVESDGEGGCGGGGGRGQNLQVIDLEDYLATALEVIERDGAYAKRWVLERGDFGDAQENPYCTRNHALAQYIGVRQPKTAILSGEVIPNQFVLKLYGYRSVTNHEVVVPSEANKVKAAELVAEWAALVVPMKKVNKDCDRFHEAHHMASGRCQFCGKYEAEVNGPDELPEEYSSQCKVLAERGWITEKTAGIAASMYKGPRKPIEKKDYSNSQYQGEVGGRMIFENLTVDMAFEREGQYGMSTIYKFFDASNNVYTWFASGCGQFKKGEVIPALKATVKAHEEYKGVKQTILSRASVYDAAEEAAVKEAKKAAVKAKKAVKKAEVAGIVAEPMQLVVGF